MPKESNMSALNVSKYILGKVNRSNFAEFDEGVSNLKLQKLLYYAQKTHYSVYDEPIFSEQLEAWQHGPVVAKVHQQFKKYGSKAIDIIGEESFIQERESIVYKKLMILDFVWDKYSPYEAWALRDLTHREPEYINNYIEDMNISIPLAEIKSKELKSEYLEYERLLCDV